MPSSSGVLPAVVLRGRVLPCDLVLAGRLWRARWLASVQCVGKASCDIDMDLAHMNGGTDPCPSNKNKYVAVEVTCSDTQPPAPAPTPPAPPVPKLPTGAFSPCVDPNSTFASQVRRRNGRRLFCAISYILKTEHLPRQARDKHRKR